MKPNTLDEILQAVRDYVYAEHDGGTKVLKIKEAKLEILDLVSKAIQENRHGFGLTVAEGKQLARRVMVALS